MSPVTIAPMTLADLDAVMEIEAVAFPTYWARTTFERELTADNGIGFYWAGKPAQQSTSQVLCYGGYWLMPPDVHIVSVATHPQWRQQGLAKQLMLHMLREAHAQGAVEAKLEVRVGNAAARTLYANLGFVEVGQRKNYYPPTELLSEREDALQLTLFDIASLVSA